MRLAVGVGASVALLAVAVPARVQACELLDYAVDVVAPPTTGELIPRDGGLLALVTAPVGDPDVVLTRDGDGSVVPLNVVLTYTQSREQLLVRGFPAAELDPDAAYTWQVGGVERGFTTGRSSDPAFPMARAVEAVVVEEGIDEACGGPTAFVDYDVTVSGVAEPVGLYAWAGEGVDSAVRFVVASSPTVRIRVWADQEVCFDVEMIDYGGNQGYAGEVCLLGPDVADGTSTGDATTGDNPTGGTSTSGASTTTSTSSPGTSSSSGEAESDSSTGGDSAGVGGVTDRGCACTHGSRPATAWWLGLLFFGWARRRRG